MAGSVGSENELKLLEIIKDKDERVEQLEKALNAQQVLIESLQEKLRQFGVDAESMHVDAGKSGENERKIGKGEEEQAQVTQPQNQVDSKISTVEAVVIAPEILLKILKNMKTRDLLKNCRLVSPKWRDLSTEILLKRKNLRLEFSSFASSGEFFVGQTPNSGRKLEELTSFLTTSKSFPCAHFIFKGNVKSDDAQAFLSQFGSCVKGLKLIGPQNLNAIRNLLMEQIPHLETLELSGFVPEGTSVPGHSVINLNMFAQFHQNPGALFIPATVPVPAPQIVTRIFSEDSPAPAPQLPFLTSLKLGEGNTPALVQEILNAAPNLQECFGIRTNEEIETLKSRIHIVKGLKIKPVRALSTINFNVLDIAMPILRQHHLTSLELDLSQAVVLANPEDAPVFCTNISNILNASQGSLKKLKLTPYPNCDSLIEWPQLENVGKLTLSGDLTRDFPRLFAPVENDVDSGVGVSRIFPNLPKIHLKEAGWIHDGQISIFRNHPKISTVKSLKISQPKAQNLELFPPLFPNVKHVSLAGVKNFAKFAPLIWQIKGLKSLQIEFDCEASEIDAGFTGMENSTCKFLRAAGRGEYQVGQVGKFRKRPSILEAKELEQLFLPRGFSENEECNANPMRQEQQDRCLATCVSFKYAFNLMPKLRVFSHRDQ